MIMDVSCFMVLFTVGAWLCRALRRIMPELSATAPPIPVWCYRVVASAAELRRVSSPTAGL